MKQTQRGNRKRASKNATVRPSKRNSPELKADGVEFTGMEDIKDEERELRETDPRFKSDLDYDGYESIEESDNDAFNLNPEGRGNPERPLDFRQRETNERFDDEDVEEDPVDPQENQKN